MTRHSRQLLSGDKPHQALDRLVGVPQRPGQISAPEVIVVSLQQAVTEAIVGRGLCTSKQSLRRFAFSQTGGTQIGQYVVMHHCPQPQTAGIAQLIGPPGFAMETDMIDIPANPCQAQARREIPIFEIAVTRIERSCRESRLPSDHQS